MDDFHALALTWDAQPSDLALPVSITPSTHYLSDRQALRTAGDQTLITQLVYLLATASDQPLPAATHPVPIAEFSLLGQWGEAFCKAINQEDFLDWAHAQQFDFHSLRIHGSRLSVIAAGRAEVFTLADASPWWSFANPIIYLSQLVDPAGLGMPYIGPQLSDPARSLPLDLTLAFHGYPMPANRLQAQTIVDELRALHSFPGFDDSGRSKSMILSELSQQRLDLLQLAAALEVNVEGFSAMTIYRTRVQLTSDSLLSRSLKEACSLLQSILVDNTLDSSSDMPVLYYFDFRQQVLQLQHHAEQIDLQPLVPATPDHRWERLGLLAEKLRADVYPDHSLSLAGVMQAYELERPLTVQATLALAQRLHQWPVAASPVVLSTARSFSELYRYRQYVGLLNDRHTVRSALSKVIDGGQLEGADGLEMLITGDPDTLQATVSKAYAHLNELTDDPEFLAIRARYRIAADSHVTLNATGGIGAYGMDGSWKSLSEAVMDHPRLSLLALQLKPVAVRAGGLLRTNDTLCLTQALRLLNFKVPTTLDEARITLKRLSVSQPLPAHQGHYWRALKPSASAQPTAWRLSTVEQQQIVTISEQFVQDKDEHLFEYLAYPLVQAKSITDVRAEADFLMIRLLASPHAQPLGEQLMNALHWHGSHASERTGRGSRSALLAAALILSLDPHPDANPTRLNAIDWHDDYYWGESVPFVRLQIESSLRRLSAGVAALAAHLLLCQKAPPLLVRGIPDAAPYLSSQAWVLFRQYVTYMERVMPGSSRQLGFIQIMQLAHLPPEGSWNSFLGSAEAAWPILEWGVVNGVLAPQPRYGALAVNQAFEALNGQRERLRSTVEAFAVPSVSLREAALNDLRNIYPDNTRLQARVLSRPGAQPATRYSLVDLHMAGRLEATAPHWHSSDIDVDYAQMAAQFSRLSPIHALFQADFTQKLEQLKAAYVQSILYGLSHLTLPRRAALEYGEVRLFSLGLDPQVGRFGVLVYASFYSNHDFYECLPKHLLIRPRRDLDYRQVLQATRNGLAQPWMRFDWPAYAEGTRPAPLAQTAVASELSIRPLDSEFVEVDTLPALDAQGRRVPRTFDSPRSHALANAIVAHLLHAGQALREQARQPVSLAQALSDEDPWADYLRRAALAPQ